MSTHRCFVIVTQDTKNDITAVRLAADYWNQLVGKTKNEAIMVVASDDVPPRDGVRVQEHINAELERSQLAIALLWHRMGTPTGNFSSGVEEELSICDRRALPAAIFLKCADIPKNQLDGKQFQDLKDFINKRKNSWMGTYEDVDDLTKKLTGCLDFLLSVVSGNRQIGSVSSDVFQRSSHSEGKNLLFLRDSLGAQRRFLSQKVGEPVFFLAIHPSQWKPMYCGLPDCSSAASAHQIRERYEVLLQDFEDCDNLAPWEILDEVAKSFLVDIRHSTEEIVKGAVWLLLSDASLYMGYAKNRYGAMRPHTGFRREDGTDRTPGWFQTALDLAGEFRFSAPAFNTWYKKRGEDQFCELLYDPSDPGRVCALKVRNYMRRDGLLPDRFPILLAEYLLFKAQHSSTSGNYLDLDVEPSKLNHFFIPLRSCGQWRTTACWLSSGDSKGSNCAISSDTHEFMNKLFSQLYLEGFSATLMAELSTSREPERGASALYKALSVLWWGYKFWFYRNEKVIYYVTVEPGEHDIKNDLKHTVAKNPVRPLTPKANKLFLCVEPCRDGCTIIIDLQFIPGDRGRDVVKKLAVEVVEIFVTLFDLNDQEQVEISEQLAMRILLAV
jgi:hypothetical protein